MKFDDKETLQLGLETTYGVDPTLDATKGMLVSNIQWKQFVGTMAERNRAYATRGADPATPTQLYSTCSFDVELAGSGAAGTAPLYGAALRACGWSETITDTVKVEYAQISTGYESAAMYVDKDGIMHKALGVRGKVALKFAAGAIPMLSFSMSGLFVPMTDVAMPDLATALDSWLQGVEFNKANTTAFTLHSYAAKANSLNIDQGNAGLNLRDKPNAAYIPITDRNITGDIAFEIESIATKNYGQTIKAGATGPLAMTHGTVAGNIVELAAPALQFGLLDETAIDGIGHFSGPIGLKRNGAAGNNELKLTVR